MSFQISSLAKSEFEQLFGLSDEQLAAVNARRVVADSKPGFPCRVSLADTEIGEELILVNYNHQSAATPFRSSHAIFVRQGACEARLEMNSVPDMLRSRVLSVRAFDEGGMMVLADLAEGPALGAAIEAIFQRPRAAYIHLHFAKPGCYAARVDRITQANNV